MMVDCIMMKLSHYHAGMGKRRNVKRYANLDTVYITLDLYLL